eukprot:gene6901-11063_t
MSMKQDLIYAGAPNTERGRSAILSVDPKGKFLLYGSGNNLILRDLQDPLKVDWYTEHTASVTAARVAPSGYWVCSGDSAGNVRIWSCTNDDKTLKLEIRPISGAVRDVCWSPDSKRVAIVGEGKSAFSHVFLWDTGSPVGTLSGHSQAILSVDHKQVRPFAIASAGEDGYVNLYKGPPYKTLDGSERSIHKKYVNGIRFSPDGSEFVTVSSDKTIAFFDGKTGAYLQHMDNTGMHTGSIFSVAWSLDGKQIITCSADKTVKFWDSATKKLISTVTLGKAIEDQQLGVAWPLADLALSVSLAGTINYFDTKDTSSLTAPKQSLVGHNTPIYSLMYDEKTNKMYSTGSQGVLIEWEYGTSKNRVVQGKQEKGSFFNVAKCGKDKLAVITSEGTIRIVELEGFSYVGDALKLTAVPNDIASLSTGDSSIVSTRKGLEFINGDKLGKFHAYNYEPSCLAVSSDDKFVAVGGGDKKIHIYSLNGDELKEEKVLSNHQGKLTSIKFSPNGKFLCSGDSNKEIILFSTGDWEVIQDELTFHGASISDMCWSHDSKYLVSGSVDKSIIIWDFENKKRIINPNGHLVGVKSVCFKDEETIISAGGDFRIVSWKFKF